MFRLLYKINIKIMVIKFKKFVWINSIKMTKSIIAVDLNYKLRNDLTLEMLNHKILK